MSDQAVSAFGTKLRSLSSNLPEKSILIDMKSIVLSSDKQILIQIVENYLLQPVFDCLNTTDEEQIEVCCVIIYNLLTNMNSSSCLENYNVSILRALSHPTPLIKITFLKLLNYLINDGIIQKLIGQYPALMNQAFDCIGSPDRSVAQGAITMFTSIGMTHEGLQVLYSKMMLEKFREVMLVNDITRFRIYEIVSSVSQKSEEGLQASQNSGFLNLLLAEVKSTDALLQLNALEILSSLGSSQHGYKYLQESGIIQYLSRKLLNLEEESLSFVLLPGLIEFFGNICKEDPPEFINHHPEVVNLLFNSLDTPDEVLLGTICSTVGKIGSTTKGKIALNTKSEQIQNFFKKAGELLSFRNDTTVSVMHSLSALFTISESSRDDLPEILLKWFDYIGPNTVDTIFNLIKLPFIELRLSALILLNAIAKLSWGVEKLCQYPGMIEYLTDRSTEFHKDCKSAKYDIVNSLVQSPIISNFMSEENLTRMKEYVKEGPFYVPTLSPEMMTEGAA